MKPFTCANKTIASIVISSVIGLMIHFVQKGVLLNHDVGWLILCAERFLSNGSYHQDFMEISPPTTIPLFTPIIWIHEITQNSIVTSARIYIGLLYISIAAISIHLTLHLWSVSYKKILAVGTIAVLLAIQSSSDIGQKDSISFLLGIPYLICLYANLNNKVLSKKTEIFVALMAAASALSKSAIILMFPSILILYHFPKNKLVWKSTIFAVIACLLLKESMVEWYFMIKENFLVYKTYNSSIEEVLIHVLPWSIMIPIFLFAKSVFSINNRNTTFIVMTLSGLIINVIIQQKTWAYHFLPLKAGCIILGIMLLERYNSKYNTPKGIMIAFSTITILVYTIQDDMSAYSPAVHKTENYLLFGGRESAIILGSVYETIQQLNPEESWVFLSTNIQGFPIQNYTKAQWGSRFPSLWQIPWIVEKQRKQETLEDIEQLNTAKKKFFENLSSDFKRWKPKYVFLRNTLYHQAIPYPLDLLEFLKSDPNFRKEWESYHPLPNLGDKVLGFMRHSVQ